MALTETVFRFLGGDPQKIQEITSIQGRMGLVADQYVSFGIPTEMSAAERLELIATIDMLYADLTNPPPGAPPHDATNFLKILRLMWLDLGLPVEELGM